MAQSVVSGNAVWRQVGVWASQVRILVTRGRYIVSLRFEITSLCQRTKLYMMTSSHGRASRIPDDVIKWKHFRRYWPFVRRIHRSPVISPHRGQWRGALMFSLICTWTNGWINNQDAGDLRRHRAHYDVIVMYRPFMRGTEPLVSPCKGTVVQRFKLFVVVRLRKRFCNVI